MSNVSSAGLTTHEWPESAPGRTRRLGPAFRVAFGILFVFGFGFANAQGTLPRASILADAIEPIAEGTEATFTVTLHGPRARSNVTVGVRVTGGTNCIGGIPPTTVRIPAGRSSVQVKVTTENDSIDELDGTITATPIAGDGCTAPANDDVLPLGPATS